MKILLLNPYVEQMHAELDYAENFRPPLGLSYVAGAALKRGHDVEILDGLVLEVKEQEFRRLLREKRDVSDLVQVKSARADRPGLAADAPAAMVADGLGGGRVLAAHAAQAGHVIPGAHDGAAVDGHGPQRRMREDEAHAEAVGEIQFGNDGLEVVAVGAEAVHPDDGGPGRGSGLDLDGVQRGAHDRRKDAGYEARRLFRT